MAGNAGSEADVLNRLRGVIVGGQVRRDQPDGSRIDLVDRDRDGVREAVRRWARQHPLLVEASGSQNIIEKILAGTKAPAWMRRHDSV